MTRIFISYRRSDSQYFTDRLYEHMARHFGAENVFQDVGDVNKIPPGEDFVEYIDNQVQSCDIVLVVISENWLATLLDRLTRDDDFVRIEIESALAHKKHIVPVLIADTDMPPSTQLPEMLRPLARRNAQRIRANPDFTKDCDTLAEGIQSVISKKDQQNLTHQQWFDVGAQKLEAEEFIGSEAAFTYAIQLAPNFIEAYVKRGKARSGEAWKMRVDKKYSEGFYRSAIEDYTVAIQLDSKQQDLFLSRGIAYQAIELHEDAIQDFMHYLKYDRTSVTGQHVVVNLLTESKIKIGDLRGALQDLDQLIDHGSSYFFVGAYGSRANIYEAMGDIDNAIANHKQAAMYAMHENNKSRKEYHINEIKRLDASK